MGTLLARLHSLPLAAVQSFWQFPEDTVREPADWSPNFIQKKVASDLSVLAPSGALADDLVAHMAIVLPRWATALAEKPVALAPLQPITASKKKKADVLCGRLLAISPPVF